MSFRLLGVLFLGFWFFRLRFGLGLCLAIHNKKGEPRATLISFLAVFILDGGNCVEYLFGLGSVDRISESRIVLIPGVEDEF